MRAYSTVFLVLVSAHSGLNQELPPTFMKCPSKAADFNECLTESIQKALKELIPGAPQFNLPQLDPVVIPKLQIGAGNGPVSVVQNLQNVLLRGYSEAKILKTEGGFESKTLTIHVFVPNLTLEADYDLNGKILSLPLQGNGHLTIIMSELEATHYITFDTVRRRGEEYLKVVGYGVNLRPKNIRYDFTDLFDGNKELRDVIVKAINDNWEVVFKDGKGAYEEAYSIVFKEYANRIFAKIPAKNIVF